MEHLVRNIAIIPARGGSKRIPRKNIVSFMGKPMLAWTVEAALRSDCFETVLVSTDSEEIAEIGRSAGAAVPFLRQERNDDYSPVSEATVSALRQAEDHWGNSYDVVTQLMANCPLRDEIDIKNAMTTFLEDGREFQISCFRSGWVNPWWAMTLDEDGMPTPLFADALTQRSQDMPELFCPTGAIWMARRTPLLEANTFYGDGYRLFPISWNSAVDIDDADDLAFAEAAATVKMKGTGSV